MSVLVRRNIHIDRRVESADHRHCQSEEIHIDRRVESASVSSESGGKLHD